MAYVADFQVTNLSGMLYSHSESSRVVGLARVRVREKVDERWKERDGTVKRYRARSSRPFVVCILSDHGNEDAMGEWTDHSEVRTIAAVEER